MPYIPCVLIISITQNNTAPREVNRVDIFITFSLRKKIFQGTERLNNVFVQGHTAKEER